MRRYLGWILLFVALLGAAHFAYAGHSRNRGHARQDTNDNRQTGSAPIVCGDGLIQGAEACDDDDTDNGDGCSSTCTIEFSYSCVGEPSVCTWVNDLSVQFDGTGDYIAYGDVTYLDGVAHATFCWWQFVDTAWPSSNLGAWSKTATNQQTFSVRLQTTRAMRFAVAPTLSSFATYVSANNAFTAAVWQHICQVYDGTQGTANNRLIVYLNGSSIVGSGTYTGTMPTTLLASASNMEIGAITAATVFPSGNIDEPAVWLISLSSAQVSEVYNSGSPTDLLATSFADPDHWWRNGDGDSGTTVIDRGSVAGNNGTLTGNPTFVSEAP